MVRIEGYGHRPGDHCGSTALRNLAAFYGWGTDEDWRGDGGDDRPAGGTGQGDPTGGTHPGDGSAYDEPTCFGLAAGLGFTYFELPDSPWRAFFGRPPWLEPAFFDHLGIGVAEREGDAFADAWAGIRRRIDEGRPVMAFTDLYYLDYFETSTHFAPHSLLAVGYEGGDRASTGRDTVHLSDSEFPGIQALPAAKLGAAMTSNHVLPLESRRLWVADPEPARGFDAAGRRAIRTTARYVLDPDAVDPPSSPGGFSSVGTEGIDGIRAFARDLPSFVDLPDPSWAVRFAYQNVERRGTGGGAFRRLYADFLHTASRRIPGVPDGAGDRMEAIADDWTAVGKGLKRISESDGDGPGMREALETVRADLLSIADREERLFSDLLDALD